MKKTFFKHLCVLFTFLVLLFSLTLSACGQKPLLFSAIKTLVSDCYICESEDESIKIRGEYGYKESNGVKDYRLKFYLEENSLSETSFYLSFDHSGKNYKDKFSNDPITDMLEVSFYIENFHEKEFPVSLSFGSTVIPLKMVSLKPEGTISIDTALSRLEQKEKAFVESLLNEKGEFTGEITAKLLVRKEKAFWYIGIKKEEGLKAFLLDGKTGDVLAVRDVF